MATLLEYAYIADAIYAEDQMTMIDSLVRNGCPDWSVRYWQAGTSSNGFQGAILEGDDDVICAFKGTRPGATLRQDVLNDLKLAVNLIPSQAMAAASMVAAAETIAGAGGGRKPLSLVGHSLGGGLAQMVGYLRGAPFVTFNAPGMLGNVELIPFVYRGTKPKGRLRGFNMILWTDPVGNYGRHIGKTERFLTPGALNPFGGAATIAHAMKNVILALELRALWAAKLLAELV